MSKDEAIEAMNAKLSELVIYVEMIIYLLLYNFHKCTFKSGSNKLFIPNQI